MAGAALEASGANSYIEGKISDIMNTTYTRNVPRPQPVCNSNGDCIIP